MTYYDTNSDLARRGLEEVLMIDLSNLDSAISTASDKVKVTELFNEYLNTKKLAHRFGINTMDYEIELKNSLSKKLKEKYQIII